MDADRTAARGPSPYLSAFGAFALAFGCSVGWGAFVMPGSTFLGLAGPWGSVLGLCLGGIAMSIFAVNFHYLMNRYPDAGGTYAYAKECFGHDQGFLSAWFLLLTYIAILWANATALPLIARALFGSAFQFGLHYQVAGFDVYLGEILLAELALILGALACLRRERAARLQSVLAVALIAGIVLCFFAALVGGMPTPEAMAPPFSSEHEAFAGTLTVFGLAPWAYVGFESITHSAAEARFSLRKSLGIMLAAVGAAAASYALLVLLSSMARPAGVGSWEAYVGSLDAYQGIEGQPAFLGASRALGPAGVVALGVASLAAILTGVVGNYVALSRLLRALALDGVLPGRLGELDEAQVPSRAILAILIASVALPLLGRTAISWIVDVTTVGATIAYAYASAAALKTARGEGNKTQQAFGLVGLVAAVLFALEFLIPNLTAVKTLATESYLILAVWGILGFAYFRAIMANESERRFGRSIVAWLILFALVLFTSIVWTRQATHAALGDASAHIEAHLEADAQLAEAGEVGDAAAGFGEEESFIRQELARADGAFLSSISILTLLVVSALLLLLDIYRLMQQRGRRVEVEKALAEESSRAKTSFLSNMSHEIRTPMNAIIGLDNIALRDKDISPRTRELLEKIGSSANHLLGLINDILDMSRIESGRMSLKNEEFSFRELIDQVSVIINGQCQEKGLSYECSIVGDVCDYYFGDDMKLKQVLINILGNSVKFTEAPGEVSLSVQQLRQDEDGCVLRFSMKDTGIGMDADFLPHLFESFTQEDEGATNRYGGSGLGMAITKNLVDMMGGQIEVQSKKGVGSTFIVTVTLAPSTRSARDQALAILPADLKTLVVDDDEIACEHAQLVLRGIGIEAEAFTNPVAALERIREAHERGEDYQLVLTDYKMAEMNGLELVRAARSLGGDGTAFVMLTGYNWDIIDEEARDDGVDAILAKPLFSDSLTKTLQAVLAPRLGGAGDVAGEEEGGLLREGAVLAGRRVLMAEDVEQNAEILLDLLELEEVEADHARNGAEAVRLFAEHPAGYYDAILMDVRMPVMDGLAATREIRATEHPDAATIPIIAMTADVFDEDVERTRAAGMNEHLAKPVEPELLYATMARLIAEREGR